jgi:hypothetical protein
VTDAESTLTEEAMEALGEILVVPFWFVARLLLGRNADTESLFILTAALMVGLFCCIAVVPAAMLFAIL